MIRQAVIEDAEAIAAVQAANWQDTYEGLLPPATAASWTTEERTVRWKKQMEQAVSGGTNLFVYEAGNQIAGFVLAGTTKDARLRMRYSGEIYGIYVHPDWKKQGIGRVLLEAGFSHLRDKQHRRAGLWVLSDQRERHFFERMEGDPVYEAPITIAGRSYQQTAYGWEDLTRLIPTSH
ncbi:GNAT family N-acetyltransferase [Alkalicoccus chagannorensis]|uniref:GNAT family N-acetyltransferase n=1 Tax=Alkalicoccus chagannorensis TaxID=427072 RepID=UPI000409F22A|nr:GNAT family N-acetyltransferase [Alkalicoccus chagannorensis]